MKIRKVAKLLLVSCLFFSSAFAVPVNINNADAQTISQSLIGISLKKAEAIVINREQKGAFKSVDDLKRVIGIGDKTLAINRDNILLSDKKLISHRVVIDNLSLSSNQSESYFPWPTAFASILITCFSVIAVIKYRLYKKFFANKRL